MQHGQFGFRHRHLQIRTGASQAWEFGKQKPLLCFVLYGSMAIRVSKSKQGKSTEKRRKTQKSTFFAFFRGKGKDDEIRAILREWKY